MDNINNDTTSFHDVINRDSVPSAPIPLPPPPLEAEVDVYWIQNALIDEIRSEGDTYYITISYKESNSLNNPHYGNIELIVSQPVTRLFDQERRNIFPIELEVGMTIDALVEAKMSQTLPLRTRAFQILVVAAPFSRIATTGKVIQTNVRNRFLIIAPLNDPNQNLRVHLNSDSVLVDSFGRTVVLQDITPGMVVWVEHEMFISESIPPQATGYLIRVLS